MNQIIRVSDLEEYGKDRDRFLFFIMRLEKAGILTSSFQKTVDGKRTERVWEASE